MKPQTSALMVGLALALAGGADAADRAAPAAVPDLLGKVTECRAITDAAARLACYDASVDRLAAAQHGGDLVVLDREQVHAARRSLFGFNVPKLPFLEGKGERARDTRKDEPVVQEVDGTIRSARQTGSSTWTLVLDDGATWETTEAPMLDPRAGDPIKIKRAAFGSYLANIHGQRAVRLRRVG